MAFPDVQVLFCAAVGPVVVVPLNTVDVPGVLVVVVLIPPAVEASSATVAGIPAVVATANVSGVADDLEATVILSIPAYNKPESFVP